MASTSDHNTHGRGARPRVLGTALLDRLGRSLSFLWSGWAGLAALCLLAALWQAGHEAYGPFILTAPLDTVVAMWRLGFDPEAWAIAGLTLQRAITGFLLVAGLGAATGIAAGYSPATMRLVKPVITVILGVPPIAWIVLAMIWFGGTDNTVRVVIVIAALPVVFVGAAQGVTSRNRALDRMAQAYGAGPIRRFFGVVLRQVADTLFPALALGTAFKVAVMAELLANAGGIGGALADARINLDIAQALAWVLVSVALLIVVEYTLIQPMRGEIDRWRRAAQPWGIKR